MGVLLTHISEYRISRLIRTVDAVSESPTKIKVFLNTVASPARTRRGSLQRSPDPVA